jgi:hypothetical protein
MTLTVATLLWGSITFAQAGPTPPEKIKPPRSPALTPPVEPAAAPASTVEQGGALNLMCFGGGSANKPTYTTIDGTNSTSGTVTGSGGAFGSFDANGTSSATVMGQRSQGFEDQVSLQIQAGEGQVRMPRTMLPPIHGGTNGWFKLKTVKVSPNEITATVAVNVLNSPKLRLDRYTGAISISGKAGDYTGQCRRFDPAQTQRQF